MERNTPVIDCDGHILEPPDLWEKYLEPKYRDRAIRVRVVRRWQQSPEAPFAKGGSAQRGGFTQVGTGNCGKCKCKLL